MRYKHRSGKKRSRRGMYDKIDSILREEDEFLIFIFGPAYGLRPDEWIETRKECLQRYLAKERR